LQNCKIARKIGFTCQSQDEKLLMNSEIGFQFSLLLHKIHSDHGIKPNIFPALNVDFI
jgi:hypothetical protein